MNTGLFRVSFKHWLIYGLCGVVITGLHARALLGQQQAAAASLRSVTVSGYGSVTAQPDHLVIRGVVNARGETVAEAMEKFTSLKEKVEKSIEEKKDPNLVLQFLGEQVTRAEQYGDPMAMENPNFIFMENMVIKIAFSNQMERIASGGTVSALVDQLNETGVSFGSAESYYAMYGYGNAEGLVEFGVADSQSMQREAEQLAMSDARERASRLAELAGCKLGRVMAIEEFGDEESYAMSAYMAMSGMGAETPRGRTTPRNGPIKMQKMLRVVFELVDR